MSFVLWLTGLSGAGKSTLSAALAPVLREKFGRCEVLDGDEVREFLSEGLGFSKEDRDTNVLRIAYVASLLARNDIPVIVAAISPYAEARARAKEIIGPDKFIEIHAHCSLEKLTERDVKGLYKKALAGEISHFTGVSDPYEAPKSPDVTVDSASETVEEGLNKILKVLEERQWIA